MRLDSILIGTTATLVGLSNALKLPNNIYNDLDVERQIVENTKGYLTSIWTQNDENSFENKNAWDVIKGDEQFSKVSFVFKKFLPLLINNCYVFSSQPLLKNMHLKLKTT